MLGKLAQLGQTALQQAGNQQQGQDGGGERDLVSSLLGSAFKYGAGTVTSDSGDTSTMTVPGEGQVMLSNCNGTKKALLIGINYTSLSKGQLKGCINDVHNTLQLITSVYGVPQQNIVQLTDDQQDAAFIPTRENIHNAMAWLVKDARPGDSLFFHYSGHGGQSRDTTGDEVDNMDETIMPLDYQSAGQITDDDMHQWMVKPLPEGVRLTCIFDSCHSGSVIDLPYTYRNDGKFEVFAKDSNKAAAAMALLQAGLAYQRGDTMGALSQLKEGVTAFIGQPGDPEAHRRTIETRTSAADVILFAGCKDSQTSADAHINQAPTGAMSWALRTVLSKNPHPTYLELLVQLRELLKGKYSQVPQMSCGRPVDVNVPFKM